VVACGFLLIERGSTRRLAREEALFEPSEVRMVIGPGAPQRKSSDLPTEMQEEMNSFTMPVLSPEAEVYQAKCLQMSTNDTLAN